MIDFNKARKHIRFDDVPGNALRKATRLFNTHTLRADKQTKQDFADAFAKFIAVTDDLAVALADVDAKAQPHFFWDDD